MRNCTTTLALLTGTLLAFGAHAAEPQTQAVTETTYAGVTVGIDAKTGKLRPLTAAESQRLSQGLIGTKQAARYGGQPRNAQEARATKRVRADGSVSVKLPADQMSQVSATIGDDGKISVYESAAPAVRKEEIK